MLEIEEQNWASQTLVNQLD